jgi:hypothetical protein
VRLNIGLTTVGAACAVLAVVGFIVGIALMASSGVQVLIPETGKEGLDWIADAQDAGNTFVAGAAIVVFAGLFGLVAFLGFYDALRQAGPLMIIAPVAGAAGMVLVTISHATPIALALDLAPRVTEATGASKESLEATFDTLARFCLLMNYFGDILIWGVTPPHYAFAILNTKLAPKWVGWVGLVAAIFAGWLGLLTPVSSFFDALSTIGFFAFFIFTASLGVVLLRRRETIEAPAVVA